MGYVKCWIHYVWATKRRAPLLEKNIRQKVFNHIKENGQKKNIHIDSVNGYSEHAHALVSLRPEQSISEVAQLMKGESSYWINKNKLIRHSFEWQDDYFAVSVSESAVNAVRSYINTQEEHHRKETFEEEYDELMKRYGFELIRG